MYASTGRSLPRGLSIVVVAAGWLIAVADVPAQHDRWPIPDDGARAVAAGEIADAYEAELKAARNGSVMPLVGLLLDESVKTEVPARAFAMLETAEHLSLEAGDIDQVLKVIDARSRCFQTDALADRIVALESLLKNGVGKDADNKRGKTGAQKQTIIAALLETAEVAIAADQLDIASRALGIATKLSKDPATVELLEQRTKQIGDRRTQLLAVQQAHRMLEANPDDGEARLTVGLDECFEQNDWAAGLEHLIKSSNPAIKALAEEELRLRGLLAPVPEDGFALAGKWWKLAEAGEYAVHSLAMERRARELYGQVVHELTDPIDKRTAQKRMASVGLPGAAQPDVVEAPADPAPALRLRWLEGRKNAADLAAAGGGGGDTEAAVEKALQWIAAHQLPDGGWSFDLVACPDCSGKCSHSGGAKATDRCGATAMALLPILGRGHTHREGKFKKTVERGIAFLTRLATAEQGKLYRDTGSLYSQGLGTAVLCECLAMTKDRRLQSPTQMAVGFLIAAQDPAGGGWRYAPRQPGDTSATGWQIMALKSANVAGISVPPGTIHKASTFLDSMASQNGARYGYTDNSRAGPTLTAIGLLCRTHLGWKKDHPALRDGVAYLAKMGPTSDLYHDFYVTQLMHAMQGDIWIAWNSKMKPLLLRSQATAGHEAGSWYDQVDGGHGPSAAGRLYCTSLATLILEVYYRGIAP
jgi:hypothetical protein